MQNFFFIYTEDQFNKVQTVGILKYLERFIRIKKIFHIWSHSEWICLQLRVLKCVISHKKYIYIYIYVCV